MVRRPKIDHDLFAPDVRLENYPLYLIGHVDHRYSARMAATLSTQKISRPKWRCLLCLSKKNGQSISEIAEITLIERSTLSRVVDRMAADGLLRRQPRRSDARITEVHITAKGRLMLNEVLRVASAQYARTVDGLSASEIDSLCRTLKKMLENLTRP